MGEELIWFYKTKIKKEYKQALFLSLIFVLCTHLYKFTNTLPNHDSLYNYYSDQNILGSGRWALSIVCGISSYYDLPWINGLLSCLYISLTVVVIVALLKIKNPILIGIFGALIATAPGTTETFFFLFTADGYMFAMLLAALAVYNSRIDENRLSRWVISGICICTSCGIYQAYVSFSLILAVIYCADLLFQNRFTKKEYLKWIFYQIILYTISLASYYLIWKLCMRFTGTVANDYQGISEAGKISAGLLLNGLISSVKTVILYFLQWNVFEHGLTIYSILNIVFIITFVISLIIATINSKIYKRKWAVLLLILCLICIIPFACIWHFVSYSVGYRAMMLESLVLLFMFTALLYERWTKPVPKNIFAVFIIIVIINNAIMANISYFYMNQCYERTYAEGVEMMSEIHDLQDEYDFNKIAVVGTRIFDVQYENIEPKTGNVQRTGKIHILSSMLEKTLLFDSEHTVAFLKETFGLTLDSLNRTERNQLLDTEKVQAMECWPAKNSIAVVGDILVIKLSDRKENE